MYDNISEFPILLAFNITLPVLLFCLDIWIENNWLQITNCRQNTKKYGLLIQNKALQNCKLNDINLYISMKSTQPNK